MRRRVVYLAGLALLAVTLALAARYGPALTLSLSLAAPATEKWLAPVWEHASREEITLPAHFGRLQADLYRPARPRGALLLVHGLSRPGRRYVPAAILTAWCGGCGRLWERHAPGCIWSRWHHSKSWVAI